MEALGFKILFYHKNKKEEERGTVCKIYLDDEVISVGNAKLYYKDNFSRKKGRKESLKKALNSKRFTREERTRIWNKYLSEFKV